MTHEWPDSPKFDIKYDLYGRGEPQVVILKPGTTTTDEIVPLVEAESRGVVSREQAEHARDVNRRIYEVMKGVPKGRDSAGRGLQTRQR